MKYPLYCPECEYEALLECETKEYKKSLLHMSCPICGHKLERDFSKGVAGVIWSSIGPGSHYHDYKAGAARNDKLADLAKKGFRYGEERLRENQRKDPDAYGVHNGQAYLKQRAKAKDKGLA